ncbi:MAG TPA: GlsB/YeaQ/YmgE family stress response membrane protein [Nocardioidaceae bacterium]|nr:GlsB/YeaQ/YmgE family stress response membrane protein [Nocardioidaceae bacterium]
MERMAGMEIDGFISAIVVGIVVGVLGRLVVPGRQRIGILLTILVGVLAALAGTFIAQAMNVAASPGIDWAELAIQVVLAAIGVSLAAAARGRS